MVLTEGVKLGRGLQAPTLAQGDATNVEQPSDLFLGKVIRSFVAGQPVFVQAAGLGLSVVHHHRMAQPRQGVGTGQPRWAGTHHGHRLAGGCGAGEQLGLGAFHQGVHRVAL